MIATPGGVGTRLVRALYETHGQFAFAGHKSSRSLIKYLQIDGAFSDASRLVDVDKL